MIELTTTELRMNEPVARALLAFAGESTEAMAGACIDGFGIDHKGLCATNGQIAVRFVIPEPLGCVDPRQYHGVCFRRTLLEKRLQEAANAGTGRIPKDAVLRFEWSEVTGGKFPRLSAAEPAREVVTEGGGVLLDIEYLERLVAVGRACRRERIKGEVTVPHMPGALIVSFKGECDPVRFEIGSVASEGLTAHVAYVTIMPMAQGRTAKEAAAKAKRATAKGRKAFTAAKAVE